MIMNTWNGECNGKKIIIREVDFDYDLHDFEITVNGEYIGKIHPDSPEETDDIRKDIEELGVDVEGWEDGCGNAVSFDTDSAFYDYWHSEN